LALILLLLVVLILLVVLVLVLMLMPTSIGSMDSWLHSSCLSMAADHTCSVMWQGSWLS
jgi:hypothetical protein